MVKAYRIHARRAKSSKRGVTAVLLAFVLAFSMVPTAEAAGPEEPAESQEGQTVSAPENADSAAEAPDVQVAFAPPVSPEDDEESATHEAASENAVPTEADDAGEPSAPASFDKDFKDGKTGIRAHVSIKNPSENDDPEGYAFSVKELSGPQRVDALSRAGIDDASGVAAFALSFAKDGKEYPFADADAVDAWLPGTEGSSVVRLSDGKAKRLSASRDADALKVRTNGMGCFVVAPPAAEEDRGAADADAASDDAVVEESSDDGHAFQQTPPASDGPDAGEGSDAGASVANGSAILHSAFAFEGGGLPYSSAELAPGTYTVSANISMMTPLGIPGYTTNPTNPEGIGGKAGIPDMPVSQNATLVVGADGSRTLTVDLVNPVFTVQRAQNGANLSVLDAVYVPIEQKADDEDYNQRVAQAGVTQRISRLTLGLNDWSGLYRFGGWSVYATTLNTFFPNAAYPAISSLDVSVDLKTAVKKVEGDRTWSFKDDATGVSLDVRADAGSSSIGSLDKASLRVRKIDDASTRAAVSALLSQRYVSVPDFALYDVQLIADGDPVALDGKTATHLSMPASSGSSLDSYANGMLTDLAGTIENGRISAAPGALGTFVLASSGDCEKRKWSRTLKDPATGVSMSYATDGTPETPLIASTPEESCQMLEWYSEYLSLPAVNKADEATQKSALALIKQEGSLANPELSGIYAAGMSMEALMGVPANLLGGGITLSDACNPTSMAIPMASPDSSVYLVTGTVESGLTKVKKLSATVDGGYGIVSLTQESTGMNAAAVPLFNAAANFDGTAQGPLSSSSEIGYLVVASAGSVSPEEPPSDTLSPGTYEVTANLAMPGQYNPAIKGLTVYANSPDNPFGPTIDENSDVTVKEAVPSVPMKANARIVVSKDGKKTLVLPVRNPIFTTQSLGTCATLSDIRAERVKPTAGGGSFSGTYGRMKDRIHMMSATLPADASSGIGTYDFKGSVLYAVPLDLTLAPSGDVSLQLTVDYGSMKKVSGSTDVPAFARPGESPSDPGIDPGPTPDTPNPGFDPSNPGGGSNPGDDPSSKDPATSDKPSGESGTLAAGTYTVSANIWVDKSTAGLPLQPHFTNPSFPPKDPVSDNATLKVESDGHAYVTVPIVIQDRIMHVKSIGGLNIVDSSSSGGGLTSITVDLGVLDASDKVIRKNCSASIELGSLARTIIGGEVNRNWSCFFQVNFSGVPNSGGGTIPAAALAAMNGETSAQSSGAVKAAKDDVSDAAAKAAEEARAARDAAGTSAASASGGAVASAVSDIADAAARNPVAAAVAGLCALAAIGGASYVLIRRRMQGMRAGEGGE